MIACTLFRQNHERKIMFKRYSRFFVISFFTVFLTIGMVIFMLSLPPKKYPTVTIDREYIKDIVLHDSFSDQVYTDSRWGAHQGIGIGFVWPEERNLPPTKRSQTDEIFLGDRKTFDPLLILTASQETTVLVSAILDYQQISFELDGQMGLLHEVNISPGGDFEVPIKIPVNSPGVHDLIVVAFADPYNGSLDPLFRSSLDIDMVGRRTQIISTGEGMAATQGVKVLKGQPVPANIMLGLGVAFSSKQQGDETTHPSALQLYVANGRPDEPYQFNVWASNFDGEMSSEYALIMFKNFHQIDINNQNLMLIDLDPDEEATVGIEVKLSDKPGVDQIQIVYIFDPYKSILRDEVRAPFVFSSPRLAIEVK